jgi:hypothetical protein
MLFFESLLGLSLDMDKSQDRVCEPAMALDPGSSFPRLPEGVAIKLVWTRP